MQPRISVYLLTLLSSFVSSISFNEFGFSPGSEENLQNLPSLTEAEICDAICVTPIRSRLFHAYQIEMLVLRNVCSGMRSQKSVLVQMISAKAYCSEKGREDFGQLRITFKDLKYAFQGVNFTFTACFDRLARYHGLVSPLDIENEIICLSAEINELQNQWLNEYYSFTRLPASEFEYKEEMDLVAIRN